MTDKYECDVCEDIKWVLISGIPDVNSGCCPFCNPHGKYPTPIPRTSWKKVKAFPKKVK